MPRKILLTGLAWSIVLLIILVLLEVGAALLFRPLTGQAFQREPMAQWIQNRLEDLIANDQAGEEDNRLLYRFHPYVGYVGRPGMRPWPRPFPPFNHHGMLSVAGHAYPYDPQPGDLVIAVLGGSVAEGFANLGGEAALQATLDRHGLVRRVVLISLATGGFKQPQQLFHLQTALLSGFHFHGVLNLDGLNELVAVQNNVDRGIHPLYPSGVHSGLMAEAYQGSRMDPATVQRIATSYRLQARERWVLETLRDTPLGHSRFASLFARLWSQHNQARLEALLAEATDAAQDAMAEDFRGPPHPTPAQPLVHAARLWADSSRLIQAVAGAFDLPYLHVLQPNQYVPDSKPLSEEERRQAYQPDSEIARVVRAGYPHLQEAGQQLVAEGIAFHDLSGVFADHADTLYWDICCHFNTTGNEILADAIGEALLRLLEKR